MKHARMPKANEDAYILKSAIKLKSKCEFLTWVDQSEIVNTSPQVDLSTVVSRSPFLALFLVMIPQVIGDKTDVFVTVRNNQS